MAARSRIEQKDSKYIWLRGGFEARLSGGMV